jgi:hypothetical protein
VLRALTTDHGKQFDPDAAFIQRQQLLEKRLQQQPGQGPGQGQAGQGASLGRSALAQQLLGSWATGVASGEAGTIGLWSCLRPVMSSISSCV